MDFDRILDNVFLEILRYLSFEELIRIRRVSRCFFRMSATALPEIKYLKLYGPWRDQSGCFEDWLHLRKPSYLHMLSSFSSPKLTELEISVFDIDAETFGNLLRNNSNIRKLTLSRSVTVWEHPQDFVSEKLETLNLDYSDDRFIRSLSTRCPNLKRLIIRSYDSTSAEALDELIFFSQIHSLAISYDSNFPHYDLTNFWYQASMRLLVLRVAYSYYSDTNLNDDLLLKISSSFPLLEVLYLCYVDVTDLGVGALAKLKHLRKVGLDYKKIKDLVDMGIQRLAEVGRLEVAQFVLSEINTMTLTKLIRFCPHLRFLCIAEVVDAQTPEAAAICLRSMSGLSRVDLTIRVNTDTDGAVWRSQQVQAALKDLKENDGNSIVFEGSSTEHIDFRNLGLFELD